MTKPMGKRAIKALIKSSADWTHVDGQGRAWAIVGHDLYCDNVWQSACGDAEALKRIATWED